MVDALDANTFDKVAVEEATEVPETSNDGASERMYNYEVRRVFQEMGKE